MSETRFVWVNRWASAGRDVGKANTSRRAAMVAVFIEISRSGGQWEQLGRHAPSAESGRRLGPSQIRCHGMAASETRRITRSPRPHRISGQRRRRTLATARAPEWHFLQTGKWRWQYAPL